MTEFLSNIPLISSLANLVEWLLLLNVVLTGAVILLAFRLSHYKHQAEDLQDELNAQIRNTISQATPEQPVSRRR